MRTTTTRAPKIEGEKACGKCGKIKPYSEFAGSYGRLIIHSYCRACATAYQRERRAKLKESKQ